MADEIEGKVNFKVIENRNDLMVGILFEFASEEEFEIALKIICDQSDAGYMHIRLKPRGGNA